MRVSVASVVVLLLLAGALAGCASPPPAPQEAAPQPEEIQAGLVSTQEASNVTSQEAAQSEFAKSLDEKFHTHNYWGGALEKVLMDANVDAGPLVRQNEFGVVGAVFDNVFTDTFAGGLGFTPFDLPDGSIVPPEATRVEVAIAYQTGPTTSGLKLGFRSSDPNSFQWLGPVPADGAPFVIPTNLTMNDIPHTTVSKWRFVLAPDGGSLPLGVFNGTAHVTIKAFREDTLYVAPPHPDFWGNATHLRLAENGSALKGERAVVQLQTTTDGSDSGFVLVQMPNGTIVPPHTSVLTLTLNWTNDAAVPDVNHIRPDIIYFASYSPRPHLPPPPTPADGGAVYALPIEAPQWDSPYATESGWSFLVYLRSDSPAEQGFGLGSVGVFDGSFTLTIDAERDAA
jgi:hypothetical protein